MLISVVSLENKNLFQSGSDDDSPHPKFKSEVRKILMNSEKRAFGAIASGQLYGMQLPANGCCLVPV